MVQKSVLMREAQESASGALKEGMTVDFTELGNPRPRWEEPHRDKTPELYRYWKPQNIKGKQNSESS